jgi:hypothetical protein
VREGGRQHAIPSPAAPVEGNRSPDAADDRVPTLGTRERRETERLIADWEAETRLLGHALARMTLDASAMTGPKWAHRFIIAVNPVVEDSSFLFYGSRFASLLALPETPDQSAPMVAQLPERYVPVFTRGCIAATLRSVPVRIEGTVLRENCRQELYRAAFIAVGSEPHRQQRLVFGAFNCRVPTGQER